MGYANLRIDCSKINHSATDFIIRFLARYLTVEVAGGDTIYARGKIKACLYNSIWNLLRLYDVNVE